MTTTLGAALPQIDLYINAGQELDISIPVLDGNGSPVPAASLASARAQVRADVNALLTLHTFSTDGTNATITGTTAAYVRLTATAAETADWQITWPKLAAVWDLEVTDTGGLSHRLTDVGTVTLDPHVTR